MCSHKRFQCSTKCFFPLCMCPYDNKCIEIMFSFHLLLQLLQSLYFALLASMLAGSTVTNFGLKYIHNQHKFNLYWTSDNFSEFVHSYKYWLRNKIYHFSSRKEANIWIIQTEVILAEKISSHKQGAISHEVFNTMSLDQLIYTICKKKTQKAAIYLIS